MAREAREEGERARRARQEAAAAKRIEAEDRMRSQLQAEGVSLTSHAPDPRAGSLPLTWLIRALGLEPQRCASLVTFRTPSS